jgi:hypothetical protein
MPAINLPRLKRECDRIAAAYDHSDRFIQLLDELLSYYADRSKRAGQTGTPPPLIDAYHVPKPVIRQVLAEMIPLAKSQPEPVLTLCDALWEVPNYEFRLIAANLLGQVTPMPPVRILDRVVSWSTPLPEDRLLDEIFGPGLAGLLNESPDSLLRQVEEWLEDAEIARQRLGLLALKSLVSSKKFGNFPLLFHLISPLTRAHPAALRIELRGVIREIALLSPLECAYFLRQMLEATQSQDTAWLARQCIALLPRESQKSLRGILRTIPTSNNS